jgi:hypothetical protein
VEPAANDDMHRKTRFPIQVVDDMHRKTRFAIQVVDDMHRKAVISMHIGRLA